MTTTEYLAAVRACPEATWNERYSSLLTDGSIRGGKQRRQRGYILRENGDRVCVIAEACLADHHANELSALRTTDEHLSGGCWILRKELL